MEDNEAPAPAAAPAAAAATKREETAAPVPPQTSENGGTDKEQDSTNKKKTTTKKARKPKEKNPKFKDVEETGSWGDMSRGEMIAAVLCFVIILVGVVVVVFVFLGNDDDDNDDGSVDRSINATASPTIAVSSRPTGFPTPLPQVPVPRQFNAALLRIDANEFTYTLIDPDNLVEDVDFYDGLVDDTTATPQQRAMSWLLYVDRRDKLADIGIRFALASIYYQMGGEEWFESTNWLSNNHHCDWQFIKCEETASLDSPRKLREVQLEQNNLVGTIPNEFAMLSDIQSLWLKKNNIEGTIPGEMLGSLEELRIIFLDENNLNGTVPIELLGSKETLDTFWAQGNNLTGPWPDEFCPESAGADAVIDNFALDCDKLECLPGCCDEYNCYYGL